MVDIQIRGEIWDNDSSEVLRWLGWRDLTCPNDIAKALEAAGGDEVTVLVNSPGGDLFSGADSLHAPEVQRENGGADSGLCGISRDRGDLCVRCDPM